VWARCAAVPGNLGVVSLLKSVFLLTYQHRQPTSPAPTNVANIYLAESAGLRFIIYKY